MKNYKHFTGFILVLLLVHCQKTELPADPGVANLISPVDKETCLDGVSINDTQSNVNFVWGTATGALSYELEIANLLTQSTQVFTSDTNELSIALSKAEPYSWLVRSVGETGTTPSVSDPWKFYLAGDAVVNYAPFPAELITPRSGANTTPDINNLVILRWTADDVDAARRDDGKWRNGLGLGRVSGRTCVVDRCGDVRRRVRRPFVAACKDLH